MRGNLTALEIARDTVDPSFYLEEEFADTGFDHIDAGSYFAAVDDFGSPAYTVDELQASGEPARFAADKVLLNALRRRGRTDRGVGASRQATASPPPPVQEFAVPSGGVAIVAGIEAGHRHPDAPLRDARRRRTAAGRLPGRGGAGRSGGGADPVDRSKVPWTMRLEGGPAKVCALERVSAAFATE